MQNFQRNSLSLIVASNFINLKVNLRIIPNKKFLQIEKVIPKKPKFFSNYQINWRGNLYWREKFQKLQIYNDAFLLKKFLSDVSGIPVQHSPFFNQEYIFVCFGKWWLQHQSRDSMLLGASLLKLTSFFVVVL